MKRFSLLLLFAASILVGCADGLGKPLCEEENTGTICIDNKYDEAIRLSFNGQVIADIGAGRTFCRDWPAGRVDVYAEELDYLIFPDYWEFSRTVFQCQETAVVLD